MTTVARALACAVLAVAVLACGRPTTPADRMKGELAVVASEHTPDILVARGRAFRRVGDLTRAEQYLSAALDVGGNPALVLPELLQVCIAADRYRAAIAYAEPWLERHPEDGKLRFVVAALRARIGDSLGAQADLERTLARAGDDANAHFAYGVLLRDRIGDPRRADEQFRAYLRLDPNGKHREEASAGLLEAVP
jgi:tetratricopeptide (TPR) repeat protein